MDGFTGRIVFRAFSPARTSSPTEFKCGDLNSAGSLRV